MSNLKLNRKMEGYYFNNCGDVQVVVSKDFETNRWLGYVDVYSHENSNGKVYKTVFSINNARTKKEACSHIICFVEGN
jgi:hypothetical protein